MHLSYIVFGGELDHQVIGWSHGLPWIEDRLAQYGIVSGRAVDDKESNILSDLLRVISYRHEQYNFSNGIYFRSSESDEWCIGQYELFFFDSHLLEHRVIEDISRASIVN